MCGQAGAIARKGGTGCGERAGAAMHRHWRRGPRSPAPPFPAIRSLFTTLSHQHPQGASSQVPGRHDLTAQPRATPVQRRPARSPASQAHQQLPRAPWRCPEASLESASALGPPEGCPPCRPPNQWTMRSWEPQVRRAGRWPPTGPPPQMSGRPPEAPPPLGAACRQPSADVLPTMPHQLQVPLP